MEDKTPNRGPTPVATKATPSDNKTVSSAPAAKNVEEQKNEPKPAPKIAQRPPALVKETRTSQSSSALNELPAFDEMCAQLVSLFEEVKKVKGTTIPSDVLTGNADAFAFAVTSISGKTFSHGDADSYFPLYSCSWPFSYAMCVDECGEDTVPWAPLWTLTF